MFFNKNNVMKEKKKSLKTLLEGDFRPLEESKEGKLKGGFGLLRKNGNCGENCDCTTNVDCSCENKNCGKNCKCSMNTTCTSSSSSLSSTTTVEPSQSEAFGLGVIGFF